MNYIIAILLLLYFVSRALTEAHKWGSLLSSYNYHSWRFVESLLPYTTSVYIFGLFKGTGLFLIGLFVYERILCYRLNKKWFKEEGWVFKIGKWNIKRYPYQDWLILIGGIICLFV